MADYRSVLIKEANNYFRAADERIEMAFKLLDDLQDYVLSIYVAGLAVECMFRAFHARKSLEFDAKHDLYHWSIRSGFETIMRPPIVNSKHQEQVDRYAAALNDLRRWWHNSHRYESAASLRKYFLDHGMIGFAKGDPLRAVAEQVYTAAFELYDLGKLKWNS